MQILNAFWLWTDRLLIYGPLALRVWALGDCAIRKSAAFPAVDKLTKPLWLAMLIAGVLIGYWGSLAQGPMSIFSLVSIVVASVYLADVRPAVREISGGTNR